MEKTKELFKKITDTKVTFQAKMDTIKDRNGMNLTEAEDIERWQEYIEELYKKTLMIQITIFLFLHLFFLGVFLITASCTALLTSIHSSSGILSGLIP